MGKSWFSGSCKCVIKSPFLTETLGMSPVGFSVCPLHLSPLPLSQGNHHMFGSHLSSRCFKIQLFLTRKEPWERGRMRRVSHGEQLQRGKGEHHCTPNVFHTSPALALHPLSCPTSPFPAFLLQELPLLPLGRGCGSPVTFPFHSCSVIFYYSLSLLDVWVLQSSSKMRFIFFVLLLFRTRSCGSLYPQLLLSNPQITEKPEFKENNRIFS